MFPRISLVSTFLTMLAALPAHAVEDRTGYLPPTAEQQAWADANMIKVTRVKPNRLALQRVAAEQGNLRAIVAGNTIVPLAAEEGSEIIGYKGAVDPTPAGSFSLASGSMAYPKKVDNSAEAWFPVVGNQNPLGSCASFSTTYYAMTSQVARLRGWNVKSDNNPAHIFSPRFIYNLINNGVDTGSYHVTAYQQMMATGSATYADFPYDAVDYKSWPTTPAIWRNAIDYRMAEIGTVYSLDTEAGLANIKQMLADGYIFNFAAAIGAWQYTNFSNDLTTTADDELFAAGVSEPRSRVVPYCVQGPVTHAMTIVGYNDELWCDLNANGVVDVGEKGALRIVNSWGAGWGDGGFIWVSYDALKTVSAVANGYAGPRQEAMTDHRAIWISARTSYKPTLVAEITTTHGLRNQMTLTVGRGPTTSTTPLSTFGFEGLQNAGGSWSFNGTTTPVEATFVIDCTDLYKTGSGNRWFANLRDNSATVAGILSKVRFVDSGNGTTLATGTNPTGGLPRPVDNDTLYSYADNPVQSNIAPVAQDQRIETIKGVTERLVLKATDINGDPLSYTIVTPPSHGTLTGAGANKVYTAVSTYQGSDSFTFKVNDGTFDSNVATVIIRIGSPGSGLLAQFFRGNTYGVIPDFSGRVADLTRFDAQINYVAASDFPSGYSSYFSSRHTGFINVTTAGSYTFFTTSDDGSNLWVDGTQVVFNDGSHGPDEKSGTVTLFPGYHALRVEYSQGGGGLTFVARWSGPGIAKAVIPANVLFHSALVNTAAPVAQAQTLTIVGDRIAPVTVTLIATDADLDPLTYFTTLPAHGSLYGVAPNLRYLPDVGYVGSDSFTYRVNDELLDSNVATVTIVMTGNAPPTVATAAAAAPSIVTSGTTTTLSVLGANDGGEDSLVYTWVAIGTPPAAVRFSGNGTNAGKTSTATFSKAGNYTFQCTIKDAGNLTVTSNSVAVTVNRAENPTIVISPLTATLNITGNQQFTAGKMDQFGNVSASQEPFIWSLSDSTSGNLSATGLFQANLTAGGPYTITATGGGTSVSGTVTVTSVNNPVGPAGFTWCANEGGTFALEGPSRVAFGRGTQFIYLENRTGLITFNKITFGDDPVEGQFKFGFVQLLSTNGRPTVASLANVIPSASGATAALSVLGADDGGEPGLTYTWMSLGTPPAAVTFSANNSNAAKLCTANFSQAGFYVFRCTIKDTGNLTTTSDVVATVVADTTPVDFKGLPVTSGLVLRMDASQISGVSEGSQLNVWTDTSGKTNDAIRQSGSSSGYPKYFASGLNGQPVVRFNSATSNTGDYFKFNRISTIRSVFWVLKENAGLGDYHSLLGDSSTYDFHRGLSANGPLWNAYHTSANIKDGVTKLMGSAINGTTTALPSGNFQLVSLVTTGNVSADQICQDRIYHGSWQGDIAEILIYDRALNSAEEIAVGSYLATKYGLVASYPLPVTPATPAELTAIPDAPGAVRVSWASVPGATRYDVWCRNSQSGTVQMISSNISSSVVNGLTSGISYEFKVAAVYGNGLAGSYSTMVTSTPIAVGPAYAAWAINSVQGMTAGMNNRPMDDPDRDGISNLLEFTLGGVPMKNSQAVLPVLSNVGNNWFLEYLRSDLSRTSTIQVVECSSDLKVWTQIQIPLTSQGAVDIADVGDADRIRVAIPATPGKQVFTRLKVTQ
jgi:PA14 domain/Bacterial Ig domain/Papain family cysteine protease/Fibronectin type III domain